MSLQRGLLISTKRNFERSASSEIHFALVDKLNIDKSKIRVKQTGVSGLISIKIDKDLDLETISEKLVELEKKEQFFMHCLKIRPIQRTTKAEIDLIKKVAIELAQGMIGKFRITVAKRHNTITSKEIITAIAANISNPVDLSLPDWVLLIEIIGDRAGISAVKPELIFSCKKAFDINDQDNWFLD